MSNREFIRIEGRNIECRWFEPAQPAQALPAIVMLHEGLGSVSMWKDFPQRLAAATGARVVAYSRFGYGRSEAPPQPHRPLEMHEYEALAVLPQVLRALEIERPILFGHSDGASIALIHAGAHPAEVAGVIALAPHVFVEDVCIESIAAARQNYLDTDLRQRLARYHNDVDGAFWLWNDLWLHPSFRAWNIERYLPAIACPVVAVQGYEDEYGTMEQLERLQRGVAHAQLVKLDRCRHSPHRDRPEQVLEAVAQLLPVAA